MLYTLMLFDTFYTHFLSWRKFKKDFEDNQKQLELKSGKIKLENPLEISDKIKVENNIKILPEKNQKIRKMPTESNCQICFKMFSNPHSLHCHIKSAHEKNPCSICGDMITRYEQNKHAKEKHPDSALCICTECGQKFHTKPTLRKHIKYYHLEVGETPCPQCDRKYPTKGALRHEPLN